MELSSDEFWTGFFDKLSRGVCSHGTYISKGFLCCNYKGKEFIYWIDNSKDPADVYRDVTTILSDSLNLCSHKEKLSRRAEFRTAGLDLEQDNHAWENVKRKKIKELFIEKFVIVNMRKYNLPLPTARKLLSHISTAIIFKKIKVSDIHFENDCIERIEGVEFRDGEVRLSKDLAYDSQFYFSTPPEKHKKKICDLWDR